MPASYSVTINADREVGVGAICDNKYQSSYCKTGFISANNGCVCPNGYYINKSNTDWYCEQCPAGSFCKDENSKDTCDAGEFSNPGATTCTACSAGTTSLDGANSCYTCSNYANVKSWSGTSGCVIASCLNGFNLSSDRTSCTSCTYTMPDNYQTSPITNCADTTEYVAQTASDSSCPEVKNYYYKNTCKNCADYFYKNTAGNCEGCTYTTPDDYQTTKISNCADGISAIAESSSNTSCADKIGYYYSSTCKTCDSGYIWSDSTKSCLNCTYSLPTGYQEDAISNCSDSLVSVKKTKNNSSCPDVSVYAYKSTCSDCKTNYATNSTGGCFSAVVSCTNNIGAIYNTDGTCTSVKMSSKTPAGVTINNNGNVMSLSYKNGGNYETNSLYCNGAVNNISGWKVISYDEAISAITSINKVNLGLEAAGASKLISSSISPYSNGSRYAIWTSEYAGKGNSSGYYLQKILYTNYTTAGLGYDCNSKSCAVTLRLYCTR